MLIYYSSNNALFVNDIADTKAYRIISHILTIGDVR